MSAFGLVRMICSPAGRADFFDGEPSIASILAILSAFASSACILIGLLTALLKSCSGTCTMAILAELPLLACIILSIAGLAKPITFGSATGALFSTFGIGFWGIFVLMIAVIVVCACDEAEPEEE